MVADEEKGKVKSNRIMLRRPMPTGSSSREKKPGGSYRFEMPHCSFTNQAWSQVNRCLFRPNRLTVSLNFISPPPQQQRPQQWRGPLKQRQDGRGCALRWGFSQHGSLAGGTQGSRWDFTNDAKVHLNFPILNLSPCRPGYPSVKSIPQRVQCFR